MTLCQDDAKLVGPVSLFLGVETANWNITQFIQAATFAKQHNVSTLFIKTFEVGSQAGGPTGVWYGGINGWDVIYQEVSKIINVIPYGFLYGDTYGKLSQEINCIVQFLSKYQKVCLDMEGSYWSNPNSASWAATIAQSVIPIPGKLWLSCPANPQQGGDMPYIKALSPAVNIYMPMVYSNYLDTTWPQDFNVQSECIQPTIDLSQEFGANNIPAIVSHIKSIGSLALSVWEYNFAIATPSLLDSVVQEFTGSNAMSVQLNKQGMVLDIIQSNQLVEGEPDLCGPWSVGALRVSGEPGKGVRGSTEDVDTFADNEVTKLGFTPANFQGSSIPNMYTFLTDALDPTSNQRNLHWWDIPSDIAHIQAAVKAGYPVIFTCDELNIVEKKTGQSPPYPWHINANHVLPVAGLDPQGDFICPDQLNNNFQGYWPPIYLASKLNPSWATVVQVVGPDPANPWLKPIPSGDPLSWPSGFNAQNFVVPPPIDYRRLAFIKQWASIVPSVSLSSGIANEAYRKYLLGEFCGPATTVEYDNVDWDGKNVRQQESAAGTFTWDSLGQVHFYPYTTK